MSSSLPKILIDATPLRTTSGLSGIGRYVFDLLHGLAENQDEWKDQLSLTALTGFNRRSAWSLTQDLKAAADDTINAKGSSGDEILSLRRALLGPAARSMGANLLHMPEIRGTPVVLPIPRIVTCHDLIPLHYPQNYLGIVVRYPEKFFAWRPGYYLRLAKDFRRYRFSDRVVAISNRTREDLLTLLGIPDRNIDVVPNGIDLRRWAQQSHLEDDRALARMGLSGRRYFLYVGSCDYRKNIPNMLEAFKIAREKEDLDLVWAGGLPEWKARTVYETAEKLGLMSHIRFLGHSSDDDLQVLYRGACAHLFLSRLEGFGLTVVEAMASSCPVILALGSGSDEVAAEAALIVDPDQPSQAADAMLRIVSDPQLRSTMVEKGLKRAQLFERRSMARGYVQSYLRALA